MKLSAPVMEWIAILCWPVLVSCLFVLLFIQQKIQNDRANQDRETMLQNQQLLLENQKLAIEYIDMMKKVVASGERNERWIQKNHKKSTE